MTGKIVAGKMTTDRMATGRMIAAALFAAIALSPLAYAQELQVGSNAYVDMYFADWHASKAKTTGPLTEYTVFTKGDPVKPTTKGALLRYVDSYVYTTLAPGASSPSTTLSGQQRVYYPPVLCLPSRVVLSDDSLVCRAQARPGARACRRR